MGFRDLDELLDDGLPLPISGKIYRIPPADAELGLWCQRLISLGMAVQMGETLPEGAPPLTLDDDDENALYRRLLGSRQNAEGEWVGGVFDELIADGVNWERIKIVGQTAMFWVGAGRELAEAFWNAGGDPEAFPPRRRPSKASTRTAAGSTTKRAGSTSGTRSRKTGSHR
jgi:hypothetical protein